MKAIDLIKSALRSIARNKTRSLLTMLGIIIGVGSVIGMMAVGKGSEESIIGELGKLGTNLINISPGEERRGGVSMDRSTANILKENDVESILQHCPIVSYASPEIETSSQVVYGSKNTRTRITGAYADYFLINNFEPSHGQLFDENTGKSLRKDCVIGTSVANELFDNPEDAIGTIIRLDKIPFRVVGVLEKKGQMFGMDRDNLIIAPFRTVQKRMLGANYCSSIVVATNDEILVDDAIQDIDDLMFHRLNKTSGGKRAYYIESQKEMTDIMTTITSMLTLLLSAIASISLLVGGIGIMNIMLVSVTERTSEIGLRLALGAQKKAILQQFLIESIIISLIGGAIGMILGYLLALIAGNIMGVKTIVTTNSVIMAFGFSAMVGMIFGFFPARKAARLNPIQALRHE